MKQLGFRKRDEHKQVVVMSAEEQEALARMDSVIEQLQNTRNLIKKRVSSINHDGTAYEKIIRSEFEISKDLLTQRQIGRCSIIAKLQCIKTSHF